MRSQFSWAGLALAFVTLQPSLSGQELASLQAAPTGVVPGRRPGTTRWIVSFKSPVMASDELRARIAAAAPLAAAALADELGGRALASRAAFIAAASALAAEVATPWWLIPGGVIEADAATVAALRAHPEVERIVADEWRTAGEAEFIREATGPANHNSDAVNALGFAGRGVTIAVIDSGCDENMAGLGRPHQTFFVNGDVNNRTGGGLGGSRLLVNRRIGLASADDLIAHGTAVAAVAAGQRWGSARGDAGQAPGAAIASYSVADLSNGGSTVATIVSAWQQVVLDAASLRIRVVNLSYTGSSDPRSSDEQAIDAAAFLGDLAIAVMGGNNNRYIDIHGAFNTLTVGAVETGSRVVAPFSMRLGGGQTYPSVVANGVNLAMPFADAETADKIASGTSYSSPQVAGAMAIYRGIRPRATSLETRAAVLATTESVAGQNRTVVDHSPSAYGHGYLRTDRLAGFALDPASIATTGVVSPQRPRASLQLPVVAGNWYVAAVAWARQDVQSVAPAAIELRIVQSGVTVATASEFWASQLKVVFQARATGIASVDVVLTRSEVGQAQQAFGLVAGASEPAFRNAAYTEMQSNGCGGRMGITSLPCIGYPYQLVASSVIGPTGLLLIGRTNVVWNGLRIPATLTAFGAPGCILATAPDLVIPVSLPSAAIDLRIPDEPRLVGMRLVHQLAVPSMANALGIRFTNAIATDIGGFLR